MPTVVKVENLSKSYVLGQKAEPGRYLTLRESLVHGGARVARALVRRGDTGGHVAPAEPFWALRDVGFEVSQGESIGIVGRNGAGKSTLLKLLSRITAPTHGRISLKGQVASLLEVGTGFHMELTGRENIFLNGAILGLSRAQIRARFDQIVDFAEVERFLDTPVKRYSSGMYLRLAFAVAAHLDAEILLVDEVLAVGDAAFQRKCLGKMGDVAQSGRTILFVSHNTGAVAELCSRAILLDRGEVAADGKVGQVLEAYSRLIQPRGSGALPPAPADSPCSLLRVRLLREDGREAHAFDLVEPIVVSVTYRVEAPVDDLQLVVTLARNMVDVFHTFDTDQLPDIPARKPGLYEARLVLPPMFLKAGGYSLRLTSGTVTRLLQDVEGAAEFEVEERSVNTQRKGYRKQRPGQVICPGTWETSAISQLEAAPLASA
jgi:lipopolysaccharide transport system ATP-binding protein